jgi:hypothetical protein
MSKWKIVFVSVFCLTVMAGSAYGQGSGASEQFSDYYINTVECFLGASTGDSDSGFTVGVNYERRLSESVGLGFFNEYSMGDMDRWTIGVPVFFHPHEGWRFMVAPGMQHRNGDDDFLLRGGVGYEFELEENWVVVPQFNLDFADGDTICVFGASIGYRF